VGNDVSPEAYVISHASVRPVGLSEIKAYLAFLKNNVKIRGINDVDWEVRIFFHRETLRQIVALRDYLADKETDEAIFVKALMCGILHGSSSISLSLPCSHTFSMSPTYVQRYATEHGLKPPKRDVFACLLKKAERVLADPLPRVKGEAYMADASRVPLADESVNLIVTSPPYFNKQTYAWDNWLRLWFLGYDYREVQRRLIQTESKEKYVELMSPCIREMYRVLKENSACFIIVGDARIGGEMINTASLLIKPIEAAGFRVKRIIRDTIEHEKKQFAFMPKDRGVKVERIIELHKGKPHFNDEDVDWSLIL
jgi:hypothetical protein